MVLAPFPLCTPITYSIDTTGVQSPGRAASAVRRAFQEWSNLTGLIFEPVPAGGVISFVWRPIQQGWFAYAQDSAVVVSPAAAWYPGWFQQSLAAHEIGHVLGLPHQQRDGSIVSDTGFRGSRTVTFEDAAMVPVEPCG